MKVAATVVNMDCSHMSEESMEYLVKYTSSDSFVFLTDNGSNIPPKPTRDYFTIYLRPNEGINLVWYRLKEFLEKRDIDVLVCCHADFFISEENWDHKIRDAFEADPKLIMAGFVGSNEVGADGGRGGGTHLGFVGGTYRNGTGSSWKHHGKLLEGVKPAACFDHCGLVYRVSAFDTLKSFFPDAPPMHFEDRILPVAANYHGYHCAMIGIDCDHLSGAKNSGMDNYYDAVKRWLDKAGIKHPEDGNYDHVAYIEAERQFLGTWRDDLHFIPFIVHDDYSIKTVNLPANHIPRVPGFIRKV